MRRDDWVLQSALKANVELRYRLTSFPAFSRWLPHYAWKERGFLPQDRDVPPREWTSGTDFATRCSGERRSVLDGCQQPEVVCIFRHEAV
ncbi:MAG: hypothetical protein C5B58_10545 [Acidobacteria bacterium]|nr:MAG: hypothetical protein C5B58_10545 [Acidobacteriota bacterium]